MGRNERGLDRFRDFAVATFSSNQGLSNSVVVSLLADLDGSVWIATFGGLNRWKNGRITTYDKRDGKLGGLAPNSLFQDHRGRIWVSTNHEFGYLENDRFIPLSSIPGGIVYGITEDSAKNLWIANQDHGLIRLSSHGEVQQIPWASLGHKDHASALAADPSRGGLWLGFFNGGVSTSQTAKFARRTQLPMGWAMGELRIFDSILTVPSGPPLRADLAD